MGAEDYQVCVMATRQIGDVRDVVRGEAVELVSHTARREEPLDM